MKKIFTTALLVITALALASCDLDLYPETSYNERNVNVEEDAGNQYTTRADMEGLRNALYNSWMKDIQEKDICDWLIYTEVHADNAYCGSPSTGEILAIQQNTQDSDNKNIKRDWDWYLGQVSNANQIICNIDDIAAADNSMTDDEHKKWKSEALIWRAYILFKMSCIWGDVPVVTTIPPAITAENIEEVYGEYFPARKPIDEVYDRIIEDLEYAAANAPEVNPANKMLLSKAVANGLLARVYAEKTRRDWDKVADYCDRVEAAGFSLVDNYGDLWGYNDDDAFRNSTESILEVTWTKSSGNWVWMMFHRNAYNPNDSFSWSKWVTPSRDLIAAYDAEGDTERKNASIIFDKCNWSTYYPADDYAFMHKIPTNASSWIIMRLGEIYLLHAEALFEKGDVAGATFYVNKIRTRAGLANLASVTMDDILKERRLELAFEGFRFYDLVRHNKAIEVCNAVDDNDEYWGTREDLDERSLLMPISQTAIDNNPSLIQNEGY